MIPFAPLIAGKLFKNFSIIFIIVGVIAGLWFLKGCSDDRKEKRLIEHNNQKRDDYVEKDIKQVVEEQQRDRIKFKKKQEMAVRVKLVSQVYQDKECILEKKAEGLSGAKLAEACNKPAALTKEEAKKAADELFKDF